MPALRLAFMGTPDFAVPSLRALVDANHDVVAVYTQPARPAGRGKKPRPCPVARAADDLAIPVFTPASLKTPEEQSRFRALDLDATVVVAYGLILPSAVLEAPRLGCFNVHASLLPRWRGAAPIHRAIMAGDRETGVAIMKMDAGLDTGPVLATETTHITDGDTTGTLHDRLSGMGAALLVPTLEAHAAGRIAPHPQREDGVTYAHKIGKAEARMDWTRPAGEIARLVRAMAPMPGAWCSFEGTRLKILSATVCPGQENGKPGTIIAAPLRVQCGTDALALHTIQRAGKAPMDADAFLRGFPILPGSRFDDAED